MDFTEFSIRYAIICAIAVVAVFLLVSLASLARIKLREFSRQRVTKLDGEDVYWITPEQEPAEDFTEHEQPAQPPAKFSEQLFRSGIESELQQLRKELAGLKDNVAQMKAARRVSPQYNEAMRLAQRGMDVRAIADECGISMGEAELVLSLSRNKQEFEDHDR